MRTLGCTGLALVSTLVFAGSAERTPVPADFSVRISCFGVRKQPLRTSELILERGILYEIASDSDEVKIVNAATGVIEILDLKRMVSTELTQKKVDDGINKLYKAVIGAGGKREKAGGRASAVAAEMSRHLADPRFEVTFDPPSGHLRLTNPTVEVDAVGEPEPDPRRLLFLSEFLALAIKLEAVRDPAAIPPFAHLEALRALTSDRGLRPVDVSILYRLAGPPLKYHWSFRYQTKISEREVAALAQIRSRLERAKFVRFDRYGNSE